MPRIYQWVKTEIIRVIPAIIFFAIAFNLINFTEGLIRAPGQPRYYTYLGVTISALVMGKVLLIVDSFPFINAFPNKPLIYNITWKFFIYSFFVLLIRLVENFIDLVYKLKNFSVASQHLQTELQYPIFWSTEMWLLSLFVVYVVATEFIRAIGRKKVIEMLLG